MSTFVIFLLVGTCIGLLFQWLAVYQSRGLPALASVGAAKPTEWPGVSLIIPACNEEATIETALESILALDYPSLQILAIDDRSTDRTGAILDAVAAEHPQLEVIHIDTLPDGWLGKLHAMHVGSQAATGTYVIYADADVHFSPDSLKIAVAWAEQDQLDMLALFPDLQVSSYALGATMAAFAGIWMAITRVRSVNSDRPGAYAGIGAFNMVRRSVFERTEGWPWLRLEIADDIGLAYLMHRHGAKARIARAEPYLSLTWYHSLSDMVHGLEKNTFAAIGRFRIWRALGAALFVAALPLCPIALLWTPLVWFGVGAILIGSLLPLAIPLPPSFPILSSVFSPIAMFIIAAIVIRSTFKTVRRGKLLWRGTEYDLDEMRENQRVLM